VTDPETVSWVQLVCYTISIVFNLIALYYFRKAEKTWKDVPRI
jgi:hypothetical protein